MQRNKRAPRKAPELDVTYITVPEEEYESPEHLFASGDDAADAAMIAEIRRDHEAGNEWAWCCVKVTALVQWNGEKFEGVAYLGGCSYASEADFCVEGGYWPDLKAEALDDLIRNVAAGERRGRAAAQLLRRLK